MNCSGVSRRAGQRGATLIASMVGLTLGLLSSVAVLTAYRVLAQQTGTANGAAMRTSLSGAALHAAQYDVQRAGFGVESAAGNCAGSAQASASGSANADLILLSGATLSNAGVLSGTAATIAAEGGALASGNALVWHWREDATDRCAGLLAGVSGAGGLRSLRPVSCSVPVSLPALTWTTADYIPADQFTGDSAIQFSAIRSNSCWPYGKGEAGSSTPGLLVNFKVGSSVAYTVCVINICR